MSRPTIGARLRRPSPAAIHQLFGGKELRAAPHAERARGGFDRVDPAGREICFAIADHTGMESTQQLQRAGMTIARTEGGADHRLTESRDHRAHLVAAQHSGAGIATFVVHAGHQRRPLGEFRFAEAKNQATRLAPRHVGPGGPNQRIGERQSDVCGTARPVRVRRHAGTPPLDPDQAEIAVRGAKCDVSLVEPRRAGASLGGAPGDRSADESAADDDDVETVGHTTVFG
jgi:hypothetical protein